MQAFEDKIKTLVQLGFGFPEARVYLTLPRSGGMNSAKAISKTCKVSKPDVYRVLAALQERGIVEKVLSTPAFFRAVPLDRISCEILQRKERELDILRERTQQLVRNLESSQVIGALQEGDIQFILIPGKSAELERRRKEIRDARESSDAVNSWKRFQRTLFIYAEETIESLQRGVKLRTITESPANENRLPKWVNDFRKDGSFMIRTVLYPPVAVLSIYDKKEALITTSPSAGLGEAPTLWTNNPSIVTVMQNYFEMLWAKAT